MANPKHIELLRQDVDVWNKWRSEHPRTRPDLSQAPPTGLEADVRFLTEAVINEVMATGRGPVSDGSLGGLNLTQANLRRANLVRADLNRAILVEADLSRADLQGANLSGCILSNANLTGANLAGANLNGATLRWAKLTGSNLEAAMLRRANLDGAEATGANFRRVDLFYGSIVQACLVRADLTGSSVYGISAWDVDLKDAKQQNLIITRANEPLVTIDDLQIAQFIYLMLNNRNVRTMINTITTKIVLILGRFAHERKRILEGIRDELRQRDYVPIIFDFERPVSRDFTETVVTLAHMARFIIADLTDPASIPKELEAIVPTLAVPVQPLLEEGAPMYAMFSDYWKYDWVLKIYHYDDLQSLQNSFEKHVIAPAERKQRELSRKRSLAL